MRLVATDGAAASLWRGPGLAVVGWVEMLRHAVPLLAALCGAMGRALRIGDAIDAHQPDGDYWYLHLPGCEPAAQGRGRGAAAVRAGLNRAAGRLPCHLETAGVRNLGFYRALGFAETARWQVPGVGPTFGSMLRTPG